MALTEDQVQKGILVSALSGLTLPEGCLKSFIASGASKFLSSAGFGTEEHVTTLLKQALDKFNDHELINFIFRSEEKVDWGLRPKHPVMEAVCDKILPTLFSDNLTIKGISNLQALDDTPVIFLGNHQSAIDVHLLHSVLKQAGAEEYASNLSAIVGYKTFEYGFLRQMSLCFNTLKVPQSLDVSDRSRELGARQVAEQSARVIKVATDQLREGHSLVVFPEGTRTRTGQLLPMLPAISRYIRDLDKALIIPWSISGADQMVPVDTYEIKKVPITVSFGKPILTRELKALTKGPHSSKVMMDTIGFLIADNLPKEKQGYYSSADSNPILQKAFSIAQSLK